MNPELRMPRRPTRRSAKNQSLGLLLREPRAKIPVKFLDEKEEVADFLGETRRDWREEEEKELII